LRNSRQQPLTIEALDFDFVNEFCRRLSHCAIANASVLPLTLLDIQAFTANQSYPIQDEPEGQVCF
jgi:hypothetical protein